MEKRWWGLGSSTMMILNGGAGLRVQMAHSCSHFSMLCSSTDEPEHVRWDKLMGACEAIYSPSFMQDLCVLLLHGIGLSIWPQMLLQFEQSRAKHSQKSESMSHVLKEALSTSFLPGNDSWWQSSEYNVSYWSLGPSIPTMSSAQHRQMSATQNAVLGIAGAGEDPDMGLLIHWIWILQRLHGGIFPVSSITYFRKSRPHNI